MKLFIAQINPTVGNLKENSSKIMEAISRAKAAGASLAVFPQMALTGYPPQDLLCNTSFIQAICEYSRQIGAVCEGISVIIGSPLPQQTEQDLSLYNGSLFFTGETGASPQLLKSTVLRDHSWFNASNYFENGEDIPVIKDHQNFTIILSTDDECLDEDFGLFVETTKKDTAKPIMIVNLAARPFETGLWQRHITCLKHQAQKLGAYILEANLIGGQDQIILEGGSVLISPQGELINQAPRFQEYTAVWDTDAEPCQQPASDNLWSEESEQIEAICLGMGDYMRKNGFTDVVLGISGGIDSALCAALAVRTLGSEHVHGIYMPSCYSTDISQEEGAKLCRSLNIDLQLLPIEGPRSAFTELLAPVFADRPFDITEENIQARIRAILVMALSNKFGWLAICTGNKAEEAVGYSTMYGDGAGGIAPIMDLYKHQVRALCRCLNKDGEIIPDLIITRPPSAELHEGQKDSDSLPDYDILDKLLQAYLEEGKTKAELVASGFASEMVDKVVRLTERSEFKRRQGPIGLKLSPMLLGLDRCMPITKGINNL
ncbi:MAG: NAD+ synthase [Candidatus Bruticola sp.]